MSFFNLTRQEYQGYTAQTNEIRRQYSTLAGDVEMSRSVDLKLMQQLTDLDHRINRLQEIWRVWAGQNHRYARRSYVKIRKLGEIHRNLTELCENIHLAQLEQSKRNKQLLILRETQWILNELCDGKSPGKERVQRLMIMMEYTKRDAGNSEIQKAFLESLGAPSESTKVVKKDSEYETFYQKQLAENGYTRQKMPGDGNCFFWSLESFTETPMLEVRNSIADYMEEYRENVEWMVEGNFDQHVENLRKSSGGKKNGEGWGEFLHARLFSEMTGRPIYIFTQIDERFGKLKDADDRPLPSDNFCFNTGSAGEPIYLLYNGYDHWDILLS